MQEEDQLHYSFCHFERNERHEQWLAGVEMKHSKSHLGLIEWFALILRIVNHLIYDGEKEALLLNAKHSTTAPILTLCQENRFYFSNLQNYILKDQQLRKTNWD